MKHLRVSWVRLKRWMLHLIISLTLGVVGWAGQQSHDGVLNHSAEAYRDVIKELIGIRYQTVPRISQVYGECKCVLAGQFGMQ